VPEIETFLPWGPFYGVWVRPDVPDDVKARLVEAYRTAAAGEDFQSLMANRGNVVMNISGDAADAFLTQWQQVTAWALEDTGAARVSPEDLGIPRP